MPKPGYYIVHFLTMYRLLAAFVLLFLLIIQRPGIFKWVLLASFFTDAVDGTLARALHVSTVKGSRLDSLADDLTVLMAILGLVFFKPGFIRQEAAWVIVLSALYILQMALAMIRYGRPSSFHTYLAKAAALFQGLFFIAIFFVPGWPTELFRLAAIFTIVDLVEEIILVLILPTWRNDVKGIIWINRGAHP